MNGYLLKKSPGRLTEHDSAHPNRGFTIVELMIVLVIMFMVASAAYSILASLTRGYTGQNVAADTQQNLRIGIDFMVRDIRMAGLDPLRLGNTGVTAATPTLFSFTADRNMDGDPNDTGEQITFAYSNGKLEYTDEISTETLNERITDFAFTYLDDDDAVTTDIDRIRTVTIDMTIRAPAGSHRPIERSSTARVRCRNLGL